MCSGSEAGSYSRLIDFVYHSTLGLRVIKKKRGSRFGLGDFLDFDRMYRKLTENAEDAREVASN